MLQLSFINQMAVDHECECRWDRPYPAHRRGLAVLALFFILDDTNRWWALVGLVPLATGLVGWYPAYLPFRVSTCKNSYDDGAIAALLGMYTPGARSPNEGNEA
jgi:hypothetical protein